MNKHDNQSGDLKMSNAPKQLKKTDFLKHVTEEPMTRGELVEALDEYSYVGSYLDYLTDHFVERGKVVKNEDGTIQLKNRKTGVSKDVFRVVEVVGEDGESSYTMESKENTGILSQEDKDAGWCLTKNAAVKRASSAVFAAYKEASTAIKDLLSEVDTPEDEGEDEDLESMD